MDWRRDRQQVLAKGGWPDTSEAELSHAYYLRLQIDCAINLPVIQERQRLSERASVLAMVPILIVVLHISWRFMSS